jgi:2-deoxy-D-gluconate 3-dehydrogenase
VTWLSDQFGLAGRTALVTGARTGIGRATALALAAAGTDLVLLGRTQAGLAELAAEIDRAHGAASAARTDGAPAPSTRTVGVDMSDLPAVRAVAEQLSQETQVDIVVNNAGIIRRAPLAQATSTDWRDVLTVNLDAVFELTRPLAAAMIARGHGAVVNIASLLSFQGGINVAAYAASKHAIAGLTQAMCNEWAPLGVNVNAVAPGYVETNNTEALRADPERYPAISARIPAGRWGQPEDIAGAVVFLCSPAARYIHGHILVVDGGWMVR